MKKREHICRLFVLLAALCFALSISPVYAASSASDSHAADTHTAADAGHGGADDGHGAADAHGDGHHSDSLSKEKLWDLFWRILNFGVLIFILVKFGAKPIGSGLAGRQKRIKDDLDELEQRKAAAEQSYREFETKLANVEKDIDTIVEKAVAQAEIEKAKIIERAEQAADDIKRQAELAVQQEIMEANRVLKSDIADQAAKMAEELIVKNLKPEDQVKIIEDYLDKVGAVQ